MKKRIGIVVLTRHISSLGGIGFYVDSFIKNTQNDFVCDLIVDRPLLQSDIPFENASKCSVVCSPDSVSYTSSKYFMFTDVSPIEFSSNILNSIFYAHKTRAYDAIFVQSFELIPGVLHSGVQTLVPTFAFTHDGYFYENYPESLDYYGALNSLVTRMPHLCQIPDHKWNCLSHQSFLPMYTSDEEYIEKTKAKPEKGTVLYNGTLRDLKRPADFVKFCVYHKKKALVITNDKGKVFFEKEFSKEGIECEIRTHIFGQDKIDFISRAEFMFHPSESEMFSYAILEALAFMPVVVYEEKWSNRYPDHILNKIRKIEDFDPKKDLSKFDPVWARKYIKSELITKGFIRFMESLKKDLGETRSPTRATVLNSVKSEGGFDVSKYWSDLRKIDKPGIEDIRIIYKLIQELGMVHDSNRTCIGNTLVQESEGLDAFF